MNAQPQDDAGRKPDASSFGGWLVVALAFALAAVLTWRKWPDLVVDFGMQLYVPWKISTGSVLYHDLGYLTGGPFSQYYNAALFKIFGVSLLTLVISNLLIAAILVTLLYRKFKAVSNTATATLIGLAIVLGFAFNQQSEIGNYNYITPYSHEVWHGMVLASFAVMLLASWVERERLRDMAGAGFCAGLVFMTKPDIFAALALGVIAAFAIFALTKKCFHFLAKSIAIFLGMAILPLLAFAIYFHRVESWAESWKSVAYAWVPLLGSDVSSAPFYKWCLGLDAPMINLKWMLLHFAVVAIIAAVCAWVFRRPMNTSANRLLAIVVVAGLAALASGFNWVDCGRPLPLLSITLIIVLCMKYKEWSQKNAPPVFSLLWSIFGLALMAKLGLFPRVWHYGFALAMPSFVGAIYLLHLMLPRLVKKIGVNERLFRGTIGLLLVVGLVKLFAQSESIYRVKNLAVGNGGDRIMAFDKASGPRDASVAEALTRLETLRADATLAVLPEGVMVNYLTRRTNPTHYFLWNPHELAAFGQANMTTDFETHAPDYILLIHRDSAEYEVKYFGQENRFGGELLQWIDRNYSTVWLIGDEPLQNYKFGIKLLKRTTLPSN